MKVKKVPLRLCLVTREKIPKKELIRIVRDENNNVLIDEFGRLNGRGCYLKKELAVIEKAKSKKIIDKELNVKVPLKIYEELKKIIER